MRFEPKHQFGKEIAGVMRNFRNICKTIAMRNQQSLAYSLLTNKLYGPSEQTGSWSTDVVSNLNEMVAECLCNNLSLTPSDEVNVS